MVVGVRLGGSIVSYSRHFSHESNVGSRLSCMTLMCGIQYHLILDESAHCWTGSKNEPNTSKMSLMSSGDIGWLPIQ